MIGLTGGIASGKSAVAERLRSLGAVVLDADLFSRKAILPHTPGWEQVKKHFPTVIEADDSINRRLLGEIVFADAPKRKILEKIIHPEVWRMIEQEAKNEESQGKLVFAEVPLLYEVGWDRFMEAVWVVNVSPCVQLRRLMERNQISKEQARQMITSQLPLEAKVKQADQVIDNNGPLSQTWEQVDALWKELEREDSVNCP